MTGKPQTSPAQTAPDLSGRIVISVDAMGGDAGPSVVVAGIAKSAQKNPEIGFILHGPIEQLEPLVARKKVLKDCCEIRDVRDVVTMEDKPSQIMRRGKGTSMWAAIDCVKNGEAAGVVSCGNTGALMALSMLRLRKLPGVNRPAIAILWPSRNPQGFNVMLDVGADVKADAEDLLQYALMGTSYIRNSMDLKCPRVGLLNVGTEEHKGRAELKEAYQLISRNAEAANYEFVGFVEGSDIPGDIADVIVTDGFTGNVAIKTGEGTASLLRSAMREAFEYSFLSRVAALLAYTSLARLSKRIDPRRVNGGVFLGLNGTVVKSHGGADATGVSAAVKLAFRLAQQGFAEKLAARVASAVESTQDDATSTDSNVDAPISRAAGDHRQ
ncbi:Phosphate acyltransferase [Tritonibacter multivorans]|uniref:Phosphate acyltransferase n=1 Tax=Tritonibacter multivorans TaxID=928856 RepID=A0A0P1GGQ7_9RHOB|nr:phosphate acyltransferase PlsX [Tritonibacter multivorans]MDA7420821.1 phosphate acyltransferase PlsX [Tritonibacter multivorans]CUH80691.1 Phosphate acyltransferase [Tritonibacter multivorans]SFC85658.1 phosphate:acyl-[acyl carrier protein] acyltransferase [Tritonibacter multivorans]